MLGRDDGLFASLERAHQAHLDDGEALRAARCAFWVGHQSHAAGRDRPGDGVDGRAQRLVEREGRDCVERGYLLLPAMFRHEAEGDLEAAAATAGEAVGVRRAVRRSGPVRACSAVEGRVPGHPRAGRGGPRAARRGDGRGHRGGASPIASGLVYCGVILGCQAAYQPRRAQEWTAALTRWCEQQPDMVAFTGRCLTHRAEIMWLHGAWPEALEEARRAARRSAEGRNELAAAEAVYLQGEVHRLAGELAAAEEAYREASRSGASPSPASRCCGWRKGTGPPRPPRSGGRSARPSRRRTARASCPPRSRSCSPSARSARRAPRRWS